MKHGFNTDAGSELGSRLVFIRVYSVFNPWLKKS
jgi:hypothetical protein